MSVINLGRTTKGNFVFYPSDGMGRDGYITYNDGGFWKDNIKQITNKPDYPKNNHMIFHSLHHDPAPFKYQSDGSGRDSYVIERNGGLVKNFEPLIKQKLSKFLRKEEKLLIRRKIFLTKSQKSYLSKLNKIQKNVINRLYNRSLEKLKNSNLKEKSLSGFFEENKIIQNFRTISPIKKYNDRENFHSINKNLDNQNNEKFLSPSKDIKQKNLFDKMIKKRNIYKNISMKNIPYYEKRDSTGKIKLIKNLKFNSNKNYNNKFNKTTGFIKNNSNLSPNNILNFKPIKKSKNYKVFVGPNDLNKQKYYSSNNSFNKNINNINNLNENNKICYDYMNKYKNIYINDKYAQNSLNLTNNKMNNTYGFKFVDETKKIDKRKPFVINDYNDYHDNYEKYLKNKKYNI